METPIPGLRGTATHELAVVIYQGHDDDGSGFCAECGDRAPCASRRHAASVIRAAGEDPLWYDGTHGIGGRGNPTDPAAAWYSRELE